LPYHFFLRVRKREDGSNPILPGLVKSVQV